MEGELKEFQHHPLLHIHVHNEDQGGKGEEMGHVEVSIADIAKQKLVKFKEPVMHAGQASGMLAFNVVVEFAPEEGYDALDA